MRLRVCVVVLLACSLVGGPALAEAADGIADDGTAPTGIAGDSAAVDGRTIDGKTTTRVSTIGERIQLTQTLALTPDRPGEIDVTLTYEIPSNVGELTTLLPASARVIDAGDFQPGKENEYDWNGADRTATLTYAFPVNRTTDESEASADPGGYVFVDTGQWALVSRPVTGTSWSWSGGGSVELDRTVETDGPGAVGARMGFLGEHAEHVRTAHGQTFRLVIPAVADPVEPPAAILDSLEAASTALSVDSRDATVFVVAAPAGDVEWGYRGLQTADADVWVTDDERLDTADNIWLHEYTHTRQSYEPTSEVRWTVEGIAVYYAAMLSLEQGLIDFDEFRATLATGERSPFHEAVLADPDTWRQRPDYQKGALVAGELDRELRLASDAERSFGDVLRAMNAHDGPVTEADFHRMIEEAGGPTVLEDAERYTGTTAVPTMWNHERHQEAFGTLPARIEPLLAADDDAYRVSGPYRNRSIGDARPIVLVEGETLAFDVELYNSGGTAGTYETRLLLDGEAVETRTERVGGGEVRTLTFERTFHTPGEYELAVGDATLPVRVTEPATVSVTAFGVDRTTVEPGESVTVEATVGNDAAIPGAAVLALLLDEVEQETTTVRLDAHDERTLQFTVRLDEPGDRILSLGGHQTTVTVDESAPAEATARDGPSGGQPGFGVGAAATVFFLLVLVARISVRVPRRSRGRR